jgi:hypothetical protein
MALAKLSHPAICPVWDGGGIRLFIAQLLSPPSSGEVSRSPLYHTYKARRSAPGFSPQTHRLPSLSLPGDFLNAANVSPLGCSMGLMFRHMVSDFDGNDGGLDSELRLIDDVVPFPDGGGLTSPSTQFVSPSAFAAFVFGSPPALWPCSIEPLDDDGEPSNNRSDVFGEGGDPVVARQSEGILIPSQGSAVVKVRYRLLRTRHC